MIGFVTSEEQAVAANAAVAKTQTDRGLPVFWLPGSYRILNGEHAGNYFVPCDDAIMQTPLMGSPAKSPTEFPEFSEIIGTLGGLDARIDLPPSDIVPAGRTFKPAQPNLPQ